MRLLDAAFDVLRKAGEPLSPAEIVRQIKSARIQIDANEPLDDASVKVELEHFASDGAESSGIVQTPSGRFTLPSMLDKDDSNRHINRDNRGIDHKPDQHRFVDCTS